MAWLQANYGLIVSILFIASEGLALVPGVKANSVFQAVFNFLQKAAGK
jgi:hypothetical protein